MKILQTNAITSWALLKPECEVILFGNEDGTAELAARLGIRHIPEVKTNNFGTPLVNHLFHSAERLASFNILAYVNSDIILTRDFTSAIKKIRFSRFLMVGRRRSVFLNDYLEFSDTRWQERLKTHVKKSGWLESAHAIDYFVFPKGTWKNLPPYAIGRAGYDNGLLYDAYSRNIPVINASNHVWAVHQIHGYAHHPSGKAGVYLGEEAQQNLSFTKNGLCHLSINNASFVLTRFGIVPALAFGHIRAAWRLLRDRFSGNIPGWARLLNQIGENSIILKRLEEIEAR
ncbi:MAG TPA: hypothetical protein PK644_03285 [bacterium]|nr:hypothetical protein [bacterium]